MRPDQIQRLRDLQEKLAETVLEEADPDNWAGSGMAMDQLTREQRGDRYWEKKNAAATFALLERTTSTIAYQPNSLIGPQDQELDIEKQINRREKEASALLDSVMRKARKAAFDDRAVRKK